MGLLVSFPKKVCLTSQLGCNVFFCILTYYVLLSENIVLLLSLLHQYIKHQFYTTPTGRTEKTNGDRCNKCGRTSQRKKNWSHQWVQCDSCDGWCHLWVNSTLHVLLATKWLLLFLHRIFGNWIFSIFCNRECEHLMTIPCQEKWYCRECLCTVESN